MNCAHQALLTAISEHAEAWRARAEAEVRKADEAGRKALAALEDAYDRRQLAHVVLGWLQAAEAGRGIERLLRKGMTPPSGTVELVGPNRERYCVADLLAALHADRDEADDRSAVAAAAGTASA